ncbi:MAG: COG4705 family protein [Segniliparus sp.]|uniref:COG4705 family protein n=1 Tax=Segniliparus sp. TaxID=2804064 RepID=UPI003F2E1A08
MSFEAAGRFQENASKVAKVTMVFWAMKIIATTLGETGADALTQQEGLGYVAGIAICAAPFVLLLIAQILVERFHPLLYWGVMVAMTTLGTALADHLDRDLGIGYLGGTLVLVSLVLVSLALWRLALGSVAVETVVSPKAEAFYWMTILFSQTLGTALGDWVADLPGSGYLLGAVVFGSALAVVAALYFWTSVSRTVLFWAAFVLTRPLGATLGDFLDKSHDQGGLAIDRWLASGVLAAVLLGLVLLVPRRRLGGQEPVDGAGPDDAACPSRDEEMPRV